MSEKELIEYVLENVRKNPMIATDAGLEAAQILGEAAAKENVQWALAGGIAMHLYGSDRLTKDVDVIASARISSVESKQPLTFGGESYTVKIGKYEIPVDWIVRSDAAAEYYRAALAEAVQLPNEMKIISPEWLVIVKLIAGRQKDLDDCVFMLRKKNSVQVNRPKVKENIVRVGGDAAWAAIMGSFRRVCDIADGRSDQPDKYYTEKE